MTAHDSLPPIDSTEYVILTNKQFEHLYDFGDTNCYGCPMIRYAVIGGASHSDPPMPWWTSPWAGLAMFAVLVLMALFSERRRQVR
jgi:hypothetical protein